MKLSCAISDGLEETYYLMDQNISTTANLDLTLLSDMMEKAAKLCRERNVPLRKKVRIHADNATSETRNQTAFKWGALMVHRSIWTQVVFTYFAVGHSHGLPDQRFSVVRSKLTTEKVTFGEPGFLYVFCVGPNISHAFCFFKSFVIKNFHRLKRETNKK